MLGRMITIVDAVWGWAVRRQGGVRVGQGTRMVWRRISARATTT